eukprot:TRINITY_DN33130_c0_g1_i1.p1 TRINITY_DN33130_c0_g1~~TRINITY_DN33130_c0_g1_i1.p1  ORF type:complete len:258 (-),score=60.47 TRINITY_DN33130_c0_g1_i1:56-829(-)
MAEPAAAVAAKEGGGAREAKNVVHEMSMWKQLIENELRTAAEWESNWGFLRMAEDKKDGDKHAASSLRPRASPRDAPGRAAGGSHSGSRLATPRGHPAAAATLRGRPGATPRAAVAGTPRAGSTPRGDSRMATPRGAGGAVAAAGMAALSTPRGGAPGVDRATGEFSHAMASGSRQISELGASSMRGLAGPEMDPVLAEACARDHRFAVLMRARLTPKERFGRQVLASHKVGWGQSLERFGVNHYGKQANSELWPSY